MPSNGARWLIFTLKRPRSRFTRISVNTCAQYCKSYEFRAVASLSTPARWLIFTGKWAMSSFNSISMRPPVQIQVHFESPLQLYSPEAAWRLIGDSKELRSTSTRILQYLPSLRCRLGSVPVFYRIVTGRYLNIVKRAGLHLRTLKGEEYMLALTRGDGGLRGGSRWMMGMRMHCALVLQRICI